MPRSLLIFLALFILATTTLSLVPTTSLHAGLIPCGLSSPDPGIPGGGTERCTLCHLLVGISRIVVFLRNIMAAVAIAVIVAMAIIYLTSGGNESRMTFAKGGMFAALIGLCIILLAWVLVNFILTLPIFNTSTGLIRTGWDTVSCSTTSLSTGAVATTTPTPSTGGGGASGTGGGLGGGGDLVTLPRDATGTPIIAPALPSPTNLTATATATDAITVTWASVPGATGYAIERCTGLTCITFTPLGTLTGTSFIDQGLASGTGYSYHVQAISSAGVSGWTNVVGATTQGVPSNPYVYVPPVDDPYGTAGGGGSGGSGSGSGGGTNVCSAGAPGDPRTGTWRPSARVTVGDPTGGLVQSNVTYIPGCLNPDPSQTMRDCGRNASNAAMTSGDIVSVRYRVGASYTQGQYFSFNSGGGSGISYPIDVSLSLFPGDFSPTDADCRTSGSTISVPRIVIGDGAGQCHLMTNSLYYLNLRIRESCSGPSCVFKINEPLSLQDTTVNCPTGTAPSSGSSTTSGSGTPPPFPWTIQGQTFNSLAAAQAAFPNMGIVINGVVVSGGIVIANVYGTSP